MATACVSEEEDFITCGVCLIEFDEENKKPKFLQCSHTVCLQCVKEICRGSSVTCPFCRNTFDQSDVTKLPNNSYAIHMIKSRKEKKITELVLATASTTQEVNWCLTCGMVEKARCALSGHSFINMTMTANTIRNLDAYLTLKEELLKLKDSGRNKLVMAIKKREEVQQHLSFVLKSIEAAKNEIIKRQDENSLRLTEMISILERKSISSVPTEQPCYEQEGKIGMSFSQLMNFVEDATADDTAEELKLKMTKTVERYERMFREAIYVAAEYDFCQKTKLSVLLFDEHDRKIPTPTCSWLEKGFRLNSSVSQAVEFRGPELKPDLMLIFYAVYSFLKRQNMNLRSVQIPPTRDVPSSSGSVTPKNVLRSSSPLLLPSLPPTVSSNSKFTLDQSIFILRLFQSGTLKGEIHIRPAPTFHPLFVQKLGDFCYKSPKTNIANKIYDRKAIAKVLVSLSMKHPNFQPVVPGMASKDPNRHKTTAVAPMKAIRAGEVGVVSVKTSACNSKVIEWTFFFPLEKFQNPQYKEQVKNEEDNELFGCVVHDQMLESMVMFSFTRNAERKDYTFTIESR